VIILNVIISLLDGMLTILEAFLFSYTPNYFCNDKKINKRSLIIVFVLIAIETCNPFSNFFDSKFVKLIISQVLLFLIICIAYRKNLKKALICTFVIRINQCWITLIMQDSFCNMFIEKGTTQTGYFCLFCIIVFIRALIAILLLKYIDKMVRLYSLILDESNRVIIFMAIIYIFQNVFCVSNNFILGFNNKTLKNILNVCFVLVIIFVLFYIIKIASKSHEIDKLNNNLKDNNNQLRKIKHDYGAQISYFYGLCLMNRYDDLKSALKDVIDNSKYSNNINLQKSNSILYLALETAVKSNDIKVTIEERADLHKLVIPELELFRVLSNIVSNAVDAMEGKGNIFAKSYQLEDKVIILIQNDGPEIPKSILLDIFKTGFTTKDNTEKGHGFGLSIVKELVKKYNGHINVASSKELTEFRIVFECINDSKN